MPTPLLATITATALQNGDFKSQLPEYYALANYVENSLVHVNQDVLSHSIKVMKSFEWMMEFEFLTDKARENAKVYFAEVVAGVSRSEQLKAVVLLHDIAKPLVFKKHSDGTANCSNLHELLGAAAVSDFEERLGLPPVVAARVKQMILLHGVIAETIMVSDQFQDTKTYITQFAKVAGDCTNELLCFIYADMMGSDLETSVPAAFKKQTGIVIDWLEQRFTTDV